MITLLGPDSRIELDIRGYQFQSAAHGPDSEWLLVTGSVECPRGRWKFVDPCLTTFELANLAIWLRQLPHGLAKEHLWFTEPNLHFQHVSEPGDILRVHLS